MKRKLVLAVVTIAILIFGIWRPVSGPPAPTDTPLTATPPPATLALTAGDCENAPPTRLTADSTAQVVRPAAGGVRRNLVVRCERALARA